MVNRQRSERRIDEASSLLFAQLTDADRRVLTTFRTYLMAPGEMLCFASQDLASLGGALRRLTDAGMLVAEKFPGAYSLTAAGFALMGNKK